MTATLISKDLGTQATSITRRIKRGGFGAFGINDELPQNVIDFVNGKQRPLDTLPPNKDKKPVKTSTEGSASKARVVRERSARPLYVSILQALPLPMLMLPASYGVYYFSSHFLPIPIAVIEGMSFELIYVSLATMNGLTPTRATYAKRVAIGAVTVSVAYNTLSWALHMDGTIMTDLNVFAFWLLAFIYGAPLAILGYFVADLIFHQKKT